jgi:hypothetical protein
MKKKIVYLITIITLVNLSALGTLIYQRWVRPDLSPGPAMQEARFDHVRLELSLTQVQVTRFEEIRHDFHSRVDSLDQVLEGMRRQMFQEIWKPQPVVTRIDSLLNQISHVQMKSQRLVILHFYQFKEVLTLEQWKKFYGIISERFPVHRAGSSLYRPAHIKDAGQ